MASTSPKPQQPQSVASAAQPAAATEVIPNLDLKAFESALNSRGFERGMKGAIGQMQSAFSSGMDIDVTLRDLALRVGIEKSIITSAQAKTIIYETDVIFKNREVRLKSDNSILYTFTFDSLANDSFNDVEIKKLQQIFKELENLKIIITDEKKSDIEKIKFIQDSPLSKILPNSSIFLLWIQKIQAAAKVATIRPSQPQSSTAMVGGNLQQGASLAPPASAKADVSQKMKPSFREFIQNVIKNIDSTYPDGSMKSFSSMLTHCLKQNDVAVSNYLFKRFAEYALAPAVEDYQSQPANYQRGGAGGLNKPPESSSQEAIMNQVAKRKECYKKYTEKTAGWRSAGYSEQRVICAIIQEMARNYPDQMRAGSFKPYNQSFKFEPDDLKGIESINFEVPKVVRPLTFDAWLTDAIKGIHANYKDKDHKIDVDSIYAPVSSAASTEKILKTVVDKYIVAVAKMCGKLDKKSQPEQDQIDNLKQTMVPADYKLFADTVSGYYKLPLAKHHYACYLGAIMKQAKDSGVLAVVLQGSPLKLEHMDLDKLTGKNFEYDYIPLPPTAAAATAAAPASTAAASASAAVDSKSKFNPNP